MTPLTPKSIRRLRKECGLSKNELGWLVGADSTFIARVEKGLEEPSDALRIALDYLYWLVIKNTCRPRSNEQGIPVGASATILALQGTDFRDKIAQGLVN